ncbi:MAG: ABC transporter permease [Chloroflexi bacterium]|nr:ABC transporter permease [Chloroflexota bacterium]MCY4110360.1 ABC transporter permease [Chloroflexota bacterium]
MGKYIAIRVLAAVPVLIGVLVIVFVLLRLIPGDPVSLLLESRGESSIFTSRIPLEAVEQLRDSYHLNDPIPVQFALYARDVVVGDFGRSFQTNQQVGDLIKELFPETLKLTMAGMGVALLVGLVSGIVSAIRHHTWVDYSGQVVAVFGVSVPDFFFGLVLIYIFSVNLRWLPALGQDRPEGMIMPAITLGVSAAAIIARMTRSSMLDVMSRDFVRTARAKGLRESAVVIRHALKNSLIPVITIVGLQFGSLLTGAIVVEVVFTRQGLGFELVEAVQRRNYPVVQALVMLASLVYVAVNIIVDVLYTYIDPRVRLQT